MNPPGGFSEDPGFGTEGAESPLPIGLIGETLAPDELLPPSGGEVATSGGMASQIFRVFVENKLAVVGVIIIVFMVLFCFVGPHVYNSDQVNQQAVLANPSNANPGSGHPLGTDGT